MPSRTRRWTRLLLVGVLTLAGCGDMGGTKSPGAAAKRAQCASVTPVKVVLQWVAQAQFAGYYAAKDKGFYADECLDVTVQEGGVNVVPQQLLASGNADFAVSHVTKTLVTRETGADLVNIGQVFQRGAYLQVAWADSGIKSLPDLRGKKVGSWGFGNELVLYAAMRAAGVNPTADTTVVQQPFDMSLLIKRQVDAVQAKTYNEYAQLLETTNPKTGKLYQPSDFVAINLQQLGYASLEDGVYARDSWLKDTKNADIAVRFLKASFKGWAFCRDNLDGCVNIVLDHGSALGKGHQTWMLNEINKLIWPTPGGIGAMDRAAWDKTIEIGLQGKVLTKRPSDDAYRTDLAEKARAALKTDGVDPVGTSYQPKAVEVTAGGK
jgi:NitT/TauT family transport system substrate-binding protein